MGTADLAQLAERIHGKDEVAGSIPAISMKNRKKPNFNGLFCIIKAEINIVIVFTF